MLTRLVWDVRTLLGEGPVWVVPERALWFVDIEGGAIHKYTPYTGARETFACGGKPSFIAPADDNSLLVGSRNAVHRAESGTLGTPVVGIVEPAHNRTNDATVDNHGRLWFGTMDDDQRQVAGALYCFDRGTLHKMGCAAVITNGPAVSADGRTLYHVDTFNRTIWRYAITETVDGPRLEDGEVFVQFGDDQGSPDGVVLDSEECLWVGVWDGWAVHRYAPDGRLLACVDLPCARVTKIAFAGEDLRTCFVTTARTGLSKSELSRQPLAGGLFVFEAPVAGRALPQVKLSYSPTLVHERADRSGS